LAKNTNYTPSFFLRQLLGSCFISDEVYEEVVTKGKERLYEDAFIVEEFCEKNVLKVRKAEENERAEAILGGKRELGLGEKTTLHLFFTLNADAIISDDRGLFLMF
jgi:predicted nucleic acid-binding protein